MKATYHYGHVYISYTQKEQTKANKVIQSLIDSGMDHTDCEDVEDGITTIPLKTYCTVGDAKEMYKQAKKVGR